MKNLVAFIQNIRFLLFFLLLQLFAFIIIRSSSGYQKAALVNSTNNISGWFYEKDRAIKDYFSLGKENIDLAQENAKLKSTQLSSYRKLIDNYIMVEDTIFEQQYQYLPANVIKNSVNSRSNVLTLNVGSKDGVKREMGVISTKGVVGFVKDVSEHFSTVICVMNKQFSITAKSKDEDIFGTFNWRTGDSFNSGTIENVPSQTILKKGDTVVTQQQEGIFPNNINLGVVESLTEEAGSNFKTVSINTTVDFYDLNHVMVIKNIFKQEFDSINNLGF